MNDVAEKSFAELLEESFKRTNYYPGAMVTGQIIEITQDWVKINVGLKSEGLVPTEEFMKAGDITVAEGDEVDVVIEALEDGFGETRLSRSKAERARSWKVLEKAHEDRTTITGSISGKVKGGFTVEVEGIRAFLPGSLVDTRPIKDFSYLEGKELEFKVIKIDRKRNNVVISRRSVMEEESSAERAELLDNLQEGQEVKGIVKNLTDYGAFVDLGGIDGLLHITDMSWKRVKHPSEVVNVGDEIDVKVLKFDRDKSRVSLGIKQLGNDPWRDIANRYPVGKKLSGKVTNITDYGCFVEIETGIEGLVHVSEMDWTNKNIHPSKVVQLGDEVDVVVLEIDEERRRISLGLKQCKANPWEDFASKHGKDERISGKIKSITDFGIFIGLDGNIDGLVHLSDISWNVPGEQAILDYKKGQEIETVILAIDAERERISLGVKQLETDPFSVFVDANPKGTVVKGTVKEVEAKKATVELAPEVEATLKASEIAREKIEDARQHLNVGDEIEAKIVNVDKKNRSITISIKEKDVSEEKQAIRDYSSAVSDTPANATLGDLLKEKMEGNKSED